MIDYKIILVITSIAALWLVFNYIDAKYRFSFIKWVNGDVSNPFVSDHMSEHDNDGDNKEAFGRSASYYEKSNVEQLQAQVEGLKERVQILEKIVTEPAYELKQEFRKL